MRVVLPSGAPRRRAVAAAVVLLLGWLSGFGTGGPGRSLTPVAAGPRPAARTAPQATPRAAPRARAVVPSLPGAVLPRLPLSPPASGHRPSSPPRVDCRKAKCVALTFDDGPGPYTARLLGMLAAHHARATFFLIGGSIRGREAIVRRELAEGHAIGDHTWSHPELSALPDRAIRAQLGRTLAEIERATGGPTDLMRPPYGATNRRVAKAARALGMAQILWSVDTNDWRDRNSRIVAHRAVAWAHRGDIILLHDIHRTTVDAVPKILTGLARRGFTFVTVPELLAAHPLKPGRTYFDEGRR